MEVLSNLEPERVLYYFEELCKIPHGSGNTEEIGDYLIAFAEEYELECEQDKIGNVIIRKPGSEGYENSEPVILQGHMDMVCEKEPGSTHDFIKDGLELVVEDGYITARDTTLGGDDGIAVAYCLAILESDSYPHPPLEAVITVDEEIGLLGANDLDFSRLSARRMINLDSEEEGIFYISCAGGMSCISDIPVRFVEAGGVFCEIEISGLVGGHSGTEINRNGANAHILMGRALYRLHQNVEYLLVDLQGGSKDNVITRECSCSILIDREEAGLLQSELAALEQELRKEFAGIEHNLTITVKAGDEKHCRAVHPVDFEKIVFYLTHIPNGVIKMSGQIPGLVETSSNLGVLSLNEAGLHASSGPRSSIESARDYVASKIEYLTEFLGGTYTASGIYPAWEYREDSPLQNTLTDVYKRMFGKAPAIKALHAGLECGLFYQGIEALDCISIGPDILDIHTTSERMSISSVQRTFDFLLEVLKELK